MTTINLKDFYSWHTHDEYIEVSDEVAAELRADKLYEAAYPLLPTMPPSIPTATSLQSTPIGAIIIVGVAPMYLEKFISPAY